MEEIKNALEQNEYINEKSPVLYKNKSDLDTIIELYQDESR